ncbi:hypothetical protein ACEPAI_7509 [Sanghuangporus weigelae]
MVNLPPKDIDDLNKEQFFQFSAKEHPGFFDETGNRICRVIVMERLHPIFELTNLDHFKQAIRDIVRAHHFSFFHEARILHFDISLHNLMVRYNNDGAVHGVLIDFDLASVGLPSGEGYHRKRTATRRFMAIDLLGNENPPHLERFDWESFFYIICWIGTHYSNGTEVQTDALDELDTDVYDIQSMFLDAHQAKNKSRRAKAINPERDMSVFDEETLGGIITWDRIWKTLKN